MQGLLRKELYMAAKYCRSYILIAAVLRLRLSGAITCLF